MALYHSRTLGPLAASQLLGISPELLRYRALTKKIRIARRHPLRFRLADVIDYAPIAQTKDRRGRRPMNIQHAVQEALDV